MKRMTFIVTALLVFSGLFYVGKVDALGVQQMFGGNILVKGTTYGCDGGCPSTTLTMGAGSGFFEGTVEADGNVNLGGTLTVVGASDFDGTLVSDYQTICNGACGTAGVATADGDLYVEDAIECDGNANVGGTLTVVGASDFDGTLVADYGTVCNGACGTAGVATADGDLYVEDALEVDGEANIAGALTIGGSSDFDGTLVSDYQTICNGACGTAGVATADGDLYVEDALEVDGAADIAGQLTLEAIPLTAAQVVHSKRTRVTVAQINAGHTLLAAVASRQYRLVDYSIIAVGGAAGGGTGIYLQATQAAGSVNLSAITVGALSQSTVNKPDTANNTLIADGASFIANDANTAITVIKNGSDITTASNIDVILSYVIE